MKISGSQSISSKRRSNIVKIVLATGFGLLCFLALYNQPYYPVSWLDEGFVLQGAVNLARYGKYAMLSSEGFRVLDQPLVANGPGVVLPIAAAFYFFGIGLLQARLVMFVFLIFTTIVFILLARRLYGTAVAIAAAFLLIALIPQEGFIFYGRMAMGNIPALAYLFAGYFLWLSYIERDRLFYGIGAGLLFGLAIVTKAQSAIILPVYILVAALDWFYFKKIELKKYLVVILMATACFAAWFLAQLLIVGWENFDQHLAAIRSSSQVTVFVFRLERIPRNVWLLIRTGAPVFILPGLLYVAWLCRKPALESLRQLPLVILVVSWLAWYVVASIGWQRYTFDAYMISALFTGKLFVDSIQYLRAGQLQSARMAPYLRVASAGFVLLILAGALWGLATQVKQVTANPDQTLQAFAAYLQENIAPKAVIESWEWQVDPLVELNFHHPTNDWVDRLTLVLTFNEKLPSTYDLLEGQPDYLIDGPFSKNTGLYAPLLSQGCCTMVYSQGPFDLYKVH